MENLEKILNKEQAEAVRCTEGPLLVLAGAGSGKTRVLTHRVAYLIENNNVAPWHILAITFTNKAAAEMRERVDALIGEGGRDIWVSTFHSMCVRILRRHIDRLGYSSSFTIYDADDSRTLMKKIIKDLNLDTRMYKERVILSAISSAKNEGLTPTDLIKQAADFRERTLANCYLEYQKRLKQSDAVDFDDLLVLTVQLLQAEPEVLDYYQERFRYIMVDEYQDTNRIQFVLIHLLAGKYHNLCVVGDDDQSIYKFRGADIENILSFEQSFPGARVIKLEQNYRSTSRILDAANAVIAHNLGRKPKRLWTAQQGGAELCFQEYQSADEEADATIRAVRDCGRSYGEQAVLYRTNAQSRLLEERCVKLNIPYRLVGGTNFYQRREIKDMLAYLRVINNGLDDLALERVINVPKRGIGAASLEKLRAYAAEVDCSLFDALPDAAEAGVGGKAAKAMMCFADDMLRLREQLETEALDIKGLIEAVRDDTGYSNELYEEGVVEAETRLENIEELINKAVSYCEEQGAEASLSAFLEEVALVAEIDNLNEDEDKLTLMTLHGAKGLEFQKVYLVGMEEGLFPSYMSITSDDKDDVEEERRLCYVGITRAREELVMSSARSRMVNGEFKRSVPSRFIEEIPDSILRKNQLPKYKSSYSEDEALLPWGGSRAAGGGFGSSYAGGHNPYGRASGGGFGSSYTAYGAGISSRDTATASPAERAGMGAAGAGQDSWLGARGQQRRGAATAGSAAFDLSRLGVRKGFGAQGTGTAQASKQAPDFGPGDRVSHIKFGEGIVEGIVDKKTDYEVTVNFDRVGIKKMFASFAKLKKV